MLELLFGWRKASRCKKLIKRMQCRLKLLKNKRSLIVKQLRDDVAQLLKHGHEQNAFDRVEQIYLDESIVAVYDLLNQFCEFILLHLSYIRKHKDCPNDIGEAVSTLIFASARCGDLPELRKIRKLFGERYGHTFATLALELLPGNLVNRQIKENLSINSVANDIKLNLVDEIWQSCLRTGPLALEYYPEIQEEQAIKTSDDEDDMSDIQNKYTINDEPQMQAFSIAEEDGKIVYIDSHSFNGSSISSTNIRSSTVSKSFPTSFELSINNYKEFSSDISSRLSNEMVYIDDIEEYKSPMDTHVNSQDQRLFMFRSSVIIAKNKLESDYNHSYVERDSSLNEKSASRRFRKSKRQRRRSLSRESSSVKDYESTIYYGERDESSRRFHHRRKHRKKIPIYEITKSGVSRLEKIENDDSKMKGLVHCNLMQPSYLRTSNDKYGFENQEAKMINTKRFIEGLGDTVSDKKESDIVSNRKENKDTYLKIMMMLPQRTNDGDYENMVRSNSFPIQKLKNESPICRHVHPKLPDYDELAATFTALKKANSQIKST